MVKSRNSGQAKNYYSRANRGRYPRRSAARGRNCYYSRRGYSRNNAYGHNRQWERRPISRPLSPVEGSEEFMTRKIEQTSAIIMRQLLSPDEPIASSSKSLNDDNGRHELGTNESIKPKENSDKQIEKGLGKTKKSSSSQINVKEIHEKIMNRITNLNDGRKKNFINANNSNGLDRAIQHILKQKRLELSRVLRDMCSSSHNPQQSGELINSIIPDIGIKIEELPIDVIEELRLTLNLDMDEDLTNPARPECYSPISISSDELSPEVDSIQVKTEQIDNFGNNFENADCSGSIEIKPEDIIDYDALGDNIEGNTEEPESTRIEETKIQDIETCQNEITHPYTPIHYSVSIKDEPPEEIENHSTTQLQELSERHLTEEQQEDNESPATFSAETVVFPDICSLRTPHRNETVGTGISNYGKPLETDDKDKTKSSNNQNNNSRWNNERGLDTLSNDDNSSSVENCIHNFIENEDELDISDLNKVSERMDMLDRSIKYLSDYRQILVKTVLKHCFRMQGVSSIPQNDTPSNIVRGFANQPGQAMENQLFEDEKIVIKRRKVEVSKQNIGKEVSEIKFEKPELLELDDVLKFPKLTDRVMFIERVDNELVLGTESGNIINASLKDGSFLHTLDVTNSPITSMAFVRGINEFMYMYVGSLDRVLRIYDYKSRKMIKAAPLADHIRCMDAMWDYVFMGCKDGTLIRYSSKKEKIEFEEKNTGNDILVLKAAQEGPRKVLLVGHRKAPIYVRDAMSGLYLRNFSNEAITPTVYALIVNNNRLFCGTAHNNILVFSFHEGNLLHRLFAQDCKGISCMRIYKNLLFSGCYNGLIYVYHLEIKKLLKAIKGPGGGILSMEVLNNQVVVGTLTGQFESVEIPGEISSVYAL